MIYIVEIPHTSQAISWSFSEKEEIIRAIDQSNYLRDHTIYDAIKGKDLLSIFGCVSTDDLRECEPGLTDLADLIDRVGCETLLYTCYDLNGDYTSEPIDEFEAYIEYQARDLNGHLVFLSDTDAQTALEDDRYWNGHKGSQARDALAKEIAKNNG